MSFDMPGVDQGCKITPPMGEVKTLEKLSPMITPPMLRADNFSNQPTLAVVIINESSPHLTVDSPPPPIFSWNFSWKINGWVILHPWRGYLYWALLDIERVKSRTHRTTSACSDFDRHWDLATIIDLAAVRSYLKLIIKVAIRKRLLFRSFHNGPSWRSQQAGSKSGLDRRLFAACFRILSDSKTVSGLKNIFDINKENWPFQE